MILINARWLRIDLTPLRNLGEAFTIGSTHLAFRNCYDLWLHYYSSFIRRRYLVNARGGGGWKPLAPYTIRKRLGKLSSKKRAKALLNPQGSTHIKRMRVRSRSGNVYERKTVIHRPPYNLEILRETGQLYNATSPKGPGNLSEVMSLGIRYGFSGSVGHKDENGNVQMTMLDLAVIHDEGKGRIPARPILVEPDEPTIKRMGTALKDAIEEFCGPPIR